jgi:catechol 2,3-dioxygenase
VYFSDPEGNGVEVFIDTPWHVAQPQGKALDLERPTEEIEEWTEAAFRDEPEFGSLPEFYARRAEHLGGRRG